MKHAIDPQSSEGHTKHYDWFIIQKGYILFFMMDSLSFHICWQVF